MPTLNLCLHALNPHTKLCEAGSLIISVLQMVTQWVQELDQGRISRNGRKVFITTLYIVANQKEVHRWEEVTDAFFIKKYVIPK